MWRHLIVRIGILIGTFFTIVTIAFFLMRLAPGGPFDGDRRLPPEVEANLRAAYHLDEPLPAQYVRYVGQILRGDLGPSFKQKDFTVNELIAEGLPVSLTVGGIALAIAVLGGIALGTFAAVNQGTRQDHASMAIAALGLALPSFVVAPLLVLVFALHLRWLPAAGFESAAHFVLPCIALAAPFLAAIARLTRGSVAEALTLPHVRTAHAKGLSARRIVLRHVLPSALAPVISFIGPAGAALLAGSVVIEEVFALPGIGRYFVQAALNRDYTLVMGAVTVYASLILLLNLLVDLSYVWLDPRLKARA